jgi:hypothetical protein
MKLPNLLFLFLIYPNILCINPDIFRKDGAMSQSADTADANADADKDVDVVLE